MRREWLEKDYYKTLRVSRDASAKEIKRAYRKLAQEFHPDNNPDDPTTETKFKEVSEAYGVLGDRKQREQYDRAREAFSRGAFVGGPGGAQQYVRIENLDDLFGDDSPFSFLGGLGDLFGQRRRSAPRQGRDVETELRLTFLEAIQGVTKSIRANGRKVTIKVPQGVADGSRIRLKGKGEAAPVGGPPGDLYVRIRVGDHPIFERSGRDLRVRAPITFTEAALGAEIDVPTLDGKVTVRIPPGTGSGKTFRISGKGVRDGKGRIGDLLVTVEVIVPSKLSNKATELLEQLREQETQNPRAHLGV
ncbi:MAG: DnaJ C-terminal domain-containing protein [Acidimicrobiia bacterium]